ncbi:MAG: peptide deformylase [Nitrospira sp.]|nr:peptide deformylase [Candidatus Manganitrophaceae bacterium]HIL35246.1 peptide deformylase [Candidatus Manganitrophaceae bacterium]
MALLEIAKLGNPILRKIAEPVTLRECHDPAFQSFLDDMIETMQKRDGVGLAAPQVFRSKQAVVIHSGSSDRYPDAPDLSLRVLLNPRLTFPTEETVEGWEGCLSLDNLRGKVSRFLRVAVEGFNRSMEPVSFEAEGFLSVVLQHEIDHLQGRVFLDRMEDFSTLTHFAEFERYWIPQPTEVT